MSTVTHSWEEINTHKHTTGKRCWWHAEWRWRSVKRSLRYKSSHRHKFVNIGLIYPTANTLLLIVNSNLNFPFCSSLHNECIQLSKPELWNILIVKSYGQMSLINSLSLDWRIFFWSVENQLRGKRKLKEHWRVRKETATLFLPPPLLRPPTAQVLRSVPISLSPK